MADPGAETDELLRLAVEGDQAAMDRLMSKHRARLRRVVAVRMDPRLAGRVDASDVVQETLAEAARKLPQYAARRRLPFFAWLRELAWEQLVRLHRRHVRAQRRSVDREQARGWRLSDQSESELAGQFVAEGTSPSGRMVRQELRDRLRAALDRLPAGDREILVMRHLEQLEIGEIAAILGITPEAVMMRRLRAFERLRRLLTQEESGADS